MTREQKTEYIDELAAKLAESGVVYLTDTSSLDVETINTLRRRCFNNKIELKVVKNTLLRKAMEKVEDKDYTELYGQLKGATSLMFSEVGNAPAKLIKDFRKKSEKPLLKGAYVQESIYTGDNQLDILVALKSKNELIGEIIGLLQSPAKNVISGLNSGGAKLAGIIKTLQEKEA